MGCNPIVKELPDNDFALYNSIRETWLHPAGNQLSWQNIEGSSPLSYSNFSCLVTVSLFCTTRSRPAPWHIIARMCSLVQSKH
jgi:hypothetical protein